MKLKTKCGQCGAGFSFPANLLGETKSCPKCGERIVINGEESPPLYSSAGIAQQSKFEQSTPVERTRKCPMCEGEVSPTAQKCRHCGSDIGPKVNKLLYGIGVVIGLIGGFLSLLATMGAKQAAERATIESQFSKDAMVYGFGILTVIMVVMFFVSAVKFSKR